MPETWILRAETGTCREISRINFKAGIQLNRIPAHSMNIHKNRNYFLPKNGNVSVPLIFLIQD